MNEEQILSILVVAVLVGAAAVAVAPVVADWLFTRRRQDDESRSR